MYNLLIRRNIRYHLRSWILALAGTVIGTAVVTGALITGDSVRSSLRQVVTERLGETKFAMAPADRYFRQELAGEITAKTGVRTTPVLRTNGLVTAPDKGTALSNVRVTGVDNSFFGFWPGRGTGGNPFVPGAGTVLLGKNVAFRLKVTEGDFIVIKVNRENFVSVNAPFVSDDPGIAMLRLRVGGIIDDKSGGRFSLENNQAAPWNVFVPLDLLAGKTGVPGFCNTILAGGSDQGDEEAKLNGTLQQCMQPADFSLYTETPEPGIYQVNSRRVFIEEPLAVAIQKSFTESSGVLTYLVNEIRHGTLNTPYSFITAAGEGILPSDPGPGGIVIGSWLASDLNAGVGDSLRVTYFVMGSDRTLTEQPASFRITAIVGTEKSKALEALMPGFPGMKNSGSCRDWETGAPVDLGRIREKDEDYWNEYRGTPKAWIRLEDGQKLWSNPFGKFTAFRIGGSMNGDQLTSAVRKVDPGKLGMVFTSVYLEGINASGNSTDFGVLFLSLGGLVVIAGLLFSGMMFSWFLLQRQNEITTLRALGYRDRHLLRIFFTECLAVTLPGALAGTVLAIAYGAGVITALNTLWQGAVHTSGLAVDIRPTSLLTGFLSGMIMNLVVFGWILFRKREPGIPSPYRFSTPRLTESPKVMRRVLVLLAGVILAALAATIMYGTIPGNFHPSPAWMAAGVLFLAGMTAAAALILHPGNNRAVPGMASLSGMILQHARYRKGRTLTAIVLLSLGTFTVLVTGLNRKTGHGNDKPSSGTGGYRLWMESTLPIGADPGTEAGKKLLGLDDPAIPPGTTFVPLPEVPGDDASCLNLNQVPKPGLKGVPEGEFDRRGAFSFSALMPGIDRDHPWLSLQKEDTQGIIPAFADLTVITWGLQKKIGDTLRYRAENGDTLLLVLAGGLENSVFQGSLLISSGLLRKYYPSSARVRTCLVDAPEEGTDGVISTLESRLQDHGARVTGTRERLAAFETVENTYLDIFLLLGGLGLVIGTAGIAVVVLRNLYDRRDELRLYHALGFSSKIIYRMLAGEYLAILFIAVAIGMIAAFTGTLPSVIGGAGNLLLPMLLAAAIPACGWFWIHRLVKKASGKRTRIMEQDTF